MRREWAFFDLEVAPFQFAVEGAVQLGRLRIWFGLHGVGLCAGLGDPSPGADGERDGLLLAGGIGLSSVMMMTIAIRDSRAEIFMCVF